MTALRHGMWKTKEYRAWLSIKTRCYNRGRHDNKYYLSRGITMCARWRNRFESFYADMGPAPSPLHVIDRKKNHLGYTPSNCRWATQAVSMQNRRHRPGFRFNTHWVTAFGRTECVSQWARETGLPDTTIQRRLATGWPVQQALSRPTRRYQRHNKE